MELRSLRVFLLDSVCSRERDLLQDGMTYPAQLQHLTLRDCDFTMLEFETFLPNCRHLQYFYIESSRLFYNLFRLTELIDLLSNSADTLSEIQIIYFRRDQEDMRRFPPLLHFPNLRSLKIQCDLLNHVKPNPRADEDGIILQWLSFNEVFPPSLEYLKICDANRLSPMLQLKFSVNRLYAVPLLKMIVVEFTPTKKEFVEGHQGWKYLTRTFARSGLRLELWTSEGRHESSENFVEHRLEGDEWVDRINRGVLLLALMW